MGFYVGETVNCKVSLTNTAGSLVNATTSMNIDITNASVTAVAMNASAEGKYYYRWQTASLGKGTYEIAYEAKDGSVISIEKDSVTLG